MASVSVLGFVPAVTRSAPIASATASAPYAKTFFIDPPWSFGDAFGRRELVEGGRDGVVDVELDVLNIDNVRTQPCCENRFSASASRSLSAACNKHASPMQYR